MINEIRFTDERIAFRMSNRFWPTADLLHLCEDVSVDLYLWTGTSIRLHVHPDVIQCYSVSCFSPHRTELPTRLVIPRCP